MSRLVDKLPRWLLVAIPALLLAAGLAVSRLGSKPAEAADESLIMTADEAGAAPVVLDDARTGDDSSGAEALAQPRADAPAAMAATPTSAPRADGTPEGAFTAAPEVSGPARAAPTSSAAPESIAAPTSSAEPLDESLFSPWMSFEDALAASRVNGRPVLLVFEAEADGPSRELQRRVFDDAASGITVRSAVIPVALEHHIASEPDPAVERLERRFGVVTYPTLVLYAPSTGRTFKRPGWSGASATLRWIIDSAASLTTR